MSAQVPTVLDTAMQVAIHVCTTHMRAAEVWMGLLQCHWCRSGSGLVPRLVVVLVGLGAFCAHRMHMCATWSPLVPVGLPREGAVELACSLSW